MDQYLRKATGLFENEEVIILFLSERTLFILHKKPIPIVKYVKDYLNGFEGYEFLFTGKLSEIDLSIFAIGTQTELHRTNTRIHEAIV